jgi:hypothetical protein
MEFHMEVAAPEFAKLTELLWLEAMDVYGTPSQDLLEQLRSKAQLLGDTTVTVHDLQAGFARGRVIHSRR